MAYPQRQQGLFVRAMITMPPCLPVSTFRQIRKNLSGVPLSPSEAAHKLLRRIVGLIPKMIFEN